MNKKLGFTLAEVLITLGIIGVVAALTAPALIQNVGSAKVGPILAKVKSTIEIANEQILSDNDANKLSSIIDYKGDSAYDSPKIRYCEILSKYIISFQKIYISPFVFLKNFNSTSSLNFNTSSFVGRV